jgi:hypothetical protein
VNEHAQFHRICQAPGDCLNLAQGRNRFCATHLKRQQRDQPLETPVKKRPQSPRELLSEAAIAYADVDASDELAYERAWERLRYAARTYCGLGRTGTPRGRRRRPIDVPGASPPPSAG